MKHFHGKNLRKGRVSEVGRAYLLTSVTRNRIRILDRLDIARIIVSGLREQQTRCRVISIAFVVMPDHFHWLVELSNGCLDDLVRNVKSVTGYRIKKKLGLKEPVWQAGYHDRAIRSDEDLRKVARYVIANPLRAGLVKHIGDYPWWDAVWLE